MNPHALNVLAETVQHNCHISDAHHGADYSLRRECAPHLEAGELALELMGRAFACYDFDRDLDGSLDAMADREIANALLHEQGEVAAGNLLGEHWGRMLLDLAQTPAELMARAVRDHLADCLVTLPRLADGADAPALHFYLGNLTHLRRDLFPGLALAYDRWHQVGDAAQLATIAERGRAHWERIGRQMLDLHRHHGVAAAGPIKALVEDSRL